MPDNWDQPSHRLISRLVDDPRWKSRTAPAFLWPPGEPMRLSTALARPTPSTRPLEATYHHVLEGPDAVLDWVKGSVLRPILGALEPDEAEAFVTQLAEAYRASYPPEADGKRPRSRSVACSSPPRRS